jgi:hypothetical protein
VLLRWLCSSWCAGGRRCEHRGAPRQQQAGPCKSPRRARRVLRGAAGRVGAAACEREQRAPRCAAPRVPRVRERPRDRRGIARRPLGERRERAAGGPAGGRPRGGAGEERCIIGAAGGGAPAQVGELHRAEGPRLEHGPAARRKRRERAPARAAGAPPRRLGRRERPRERGDVAGLRRREAAAAVGGHGGGDLAVQRAVVEARRGARPREARERAWVARTAREPRRQRVCDGGKQRLVGVARGGERPQQADALPRAGARQHARPLGNLRTGAAAAGGRALGRGMGMGTGA